MEFHRAFAVIGLLMAVAPAASVLHEKPAAADDAKPTTPDGKPLPEGMRLGDTASVGTGTVQVYLWKLPDGTDYEMVYVRAGNFTMGAGVYENALKHTHPMPDGYFIGRNDVTWGQYLAFCAAASHEKPERPDWAGTDAHPVVNVTWDDAKAFCAWAKVRLPSEAEWEKAARGTDGRNYPWGNDWDAGKCCNNANSGGHTAPVGSFPQGASPYGALDMAGNVWQWCEDWYDGGSYARYAQGNVTPPQSGSFRVGRGGCWDDEASFCRSSGRIRDVPSARRDVGVGFRACR
jgi:formylglycine-generating enzyme required for sulfatase activity